MRADVSKYLLFLGGVSASLLLSACSRAETPQLTINELSSKYGLDICAGSSALPWDKPMLDARIVFFEVPSDECKTNFFRSLERAAKRWEHPFGDQNRMQGILTAGPLFLAQVEEPRRIFVMISSP
jgi:hypothetical protein